MASATRWWDIRPAQSAQAKTYTCPICHGFLPAMTPNTLLFPEGDRQRRRHAHTECVLRERKSGRLLTKTEWERATRAPGTITRPWWRRLLGIGRPRSSPAGPPDPRLPDGS